MNGLRFSIALAALLCLPLHAQQRRHSADERWVMFQEYLKRRAAEVTRANLSGINTLEEWKKRRPEVRRRMLFALGLDPMPRRTPLNPRVTGSLERETHRVEKLVFESLPGLYVTGNLYLHKAPGRYPAIVYVSGHSPGPWGAKVHYQHHGIWLARNGYVALLLDTNEFGEVPGIHHGTHDLEMWYWLSLGYTPASVEVWNAMRALDYLETRPEADTRRAGITGISGGGAITWFTAAVDERFQAAASVCATWTVEHHTSLDAVHENCDCIYFPNTWQDDLPSMGALIAPRPFKILSARRDPSFPVAGYKEAYRRVRPIYELYSAGERIAEYDHDAPHQDIPAFRKEADEWLNRWLKDDPTPFDEGAIVREEGKTLAVLDHLPPAAVNDGIHATFIPAYRLRPWKTREQWEARRKQLLGELNDKVFRAFPKDKVPLETWKSKEGGWTSRYADSFNLEFTTEPGIRVHGQLFVPRDGKTSRGALVYVKGAADVVYPVDYDPLLPVLDKLTVLVLNPRGVDYPMSNYKRATVKRTAALLGATLESMQVWDLLRGLEVLSEFNPSSLAVYGRKEMGALALYAAALDPRISRVILDDPPASHWQGPALLNILRLTDLAEAAALVAPRQVVSLTPLPEAYRYTDSIYKLYGKRIRIAGYSLWSACQ